MSERPQAGCPACIWYGKECTHPSESLNCVDFEPRSSDDHNEAPDTEPTPPPLSEEDRCLRELVARYPDGELPETLKLLLRMRQSSIFQAAERCANHLAKQSSPTKRLLLEMSQSPVFRVAMKLEQRFAPIMARHAAILREMQEGQLSPSIEVPAVKQQSARLCSCEPKASTLPNREELTFQLLVEIHAMFSEMLTEMRNQGIEQKHHGELLNNLDNAVEDIAYAPDDKDDEERGGIKV
ncbi:MAG: hypothetical protein ACYDBB_21490 [Armatimonadota bacterium]